VPSGLAGVTFFFAYALAQVSARYLTDKVRPQEDQHIAIIVFTFVSAYRTGKGTTGSSSSSGSDWRLGEVPLRTRSLEHRQLVPQQRAASLVLHLRPLVSFIINFIIATLLLRWCVVVFFLLAIPGLVGILLLVFCFRPTEMLDKAD